MTKTDYEQFAVTLAQIAERMADWHPDALAYVAEEVMDAKQNVDAMVEKINQARKVA